ncbi:MAG: UDP-N-acetylmuramoyl-L-alanyl-D-glutamate--2,6-diaminopimelate ligase, partial [Lachnospiraceae bacterium]|nr:UDP-N-acetylmuramoyl-L-alanyl-D-glutamate--2,6-diaminopimelate ligase [Lachnospiraceae bacterium]
MSNLNLHKLALYKKALEIGQLFVSAEGDMDTMVEGLTYDSRLVGPGTLFICKGAAFKEAYLASAIEKGAASYISETEYETGKDIPHIIVSDIRMAMCYLANIYFGFPHWDLTLIGITGTKGKSTTAYY